MLAKIHQSFNRVDEGLHTHYEILSVFTYTGRMVLHHLVRVYQWGGRREELCWREVSRDMINYYACQFMGYHQVNNRMIDTLRLSPQWAIVRRAEKEETLASVAWEEDTNPSFCQDAWRH